MDNGFRSSIEATHEDYPDMAARRFTFYTNTKRHLAVKKLKSMCRSCKGQKREWDKHRFVLTGEIIIRDDLNATWQDGTVDPSLVPVFAKYKKVKTKRKVK